MSNDWNQGLTQTFSDAYDKGYGSAEDIRKRRYDLQKQAFDAYAQKYNLTPEEITQAQSMLLKGDTNFPTTHTGPTGQPAPDVVTGYKTVPAEGPRDLVGQNVGKTGYEFVPGPQPTAQIPQLGKGPVPMGEQPIPKNPIYIITKDPATGKEEINLAPSDVSDPHQLVRGMAGSPPKPAATGPGGKPKETYADVRERMRWDSFVHENDPATAGKGTTVGTIGNANVRIKRAQKIVSKDKVTAAEAHAALADIAGILQGGSPTDIGLKGQSYDTLQQKAGELLQRFGNTQDVLPPDIKKRLVEDLKDMQNTSKGILDYRFDYIAKARKELVDKHKDEFKSLREGALGSLDEEKGDNQSTEHDEALKWANANPNDPRAKAIKQKAQEALK